MHMYDDYKVIKKRKYLSELVIRGDARAPICFHKHFAINKTIASAFPFINNLLVTRNN